MSSNEADFPLHYSPLSIESTIYKTWQAAGMFAASAQKASKPPYVMVIPPPNVTGRLHMGHALNNTIQDMLIRYKRMEGYETVWIPGTDHAGIATQTVVKKHLIQQGVDIERMNDRAFIDTIWKWKEKYGGMILDQLKRLGCSLDWSRQCFTMDEKGSYATRYAFKRLFEDGYIYRGERLVNWCPVDQTALSDDEVDVAPNGEDGHLWTLQYPLVGSQGSLQVSTTRPETLFGDMAIAVHPNDERYLKYIGSQVHLPLTGRQLPVLADTMVDPTFGTGCVKITPAHDPHDFALGKRHHLTPLNIMEKDARMNAHVPSAFRGLSREACRSAVLNALKAKGLLVKTEAKRIAIGRSYRSKAIIEYRLSTEWFLKMKPLAQKALERMEATDALKIFPSKWENVYRHWLQNIEDWCLSRQIKWGHRIPAWIHRSSGAIAVIPDPKDPLSIPQEVQHDPHDWHAETDVLDTWFSSALWPMSVMGWPETTRDFERYFPTSALSTAKDILFFWVARMNMLSLYFTGRLPYREVYFHATVMDARGKVMSKSKGNGIDPKHVIFGASLSELQSPVHEANPSNAEKLLSDLKQHYAKGFEGVGADALRYTLIYLTSSGQEFHLSMKDFHELGRRFVTKLWNAARFIFMHLDKLPEGGTVQPPSPPQETRLDTADTWLLGRLQVTLFHVHDALKTYAFSKLGPLYYEFVWHDFCDWSLELAKPMLRDPQTETFHAKIHVLSDVFDQTLRMLHPMLPFVTEYLWQQLQKRTIAKNLCPSISEHRQNANYLIICPFPQGKAPSQDILDDQKHFDLLKKLTLTLRRFRTQHQLKQATRLSVFYEPLKMPRESPTTQPLPHLSNEHLRMLSHLTQITLVHSAGDLNDPKTLICENIRMLVALPEGLSTPQDTQKKRFHLMQRLSKHHAQQNQLEARLREQEFLDNAPPQIIKKHRQHLATLKATSKTLEKELRDLSPPSE